MHKRLFAALALASALVIAGPVVFGQEYWNPDATAVSAVA
jgi:hypothetical protein